LAAADLRLPAVFSDIWSSNARSP
ncbi:hypothetical protein EMGBS6_13640, partial [Opitutia bacterium]